MNKYQKCKMVLRQQLIGAGFFEALAAMEFAERFHCGMRKDGTTPEFSHQISIALYVMTLPDLIDREGTIATIFLHDTPEDYGISPGEIADIFIDRDFGLRVAQSTNIMAKKFRDEKRDEAALFEQMARDPRASIAKGADRVHNLQSMIGVFTAEKQASYIEFAELRILPMLKTARRTFPHQVRAYENIKFVMRSQIELISASLGARA
jgi:(p)ppGpp synthase/HD superfamily hydrolase